MDKNRHTCYSSIRGQEVEITFNTFPKNDKEDAITDVKVFFTDTEEEVTTYPYGVVISACQKHLREQKAAFDKAVICAEGDY